MARIDINTASLSLVFLLLVIPIIVSFSYRLNLGRRIIYLALRMATQLVLIGFFLKFLFQRNNAFLNLLWLVVMMLVAVYSALRNSPLKVRKAILPLFASFFLATFSVLMFVNIAVIRLDNVFDARYLIVLGGMLLGNSLRGNIIGVSHFYQNLKKEEKKFLYLLGQGANLKEASLPYVRESLNLALRPTLASMATMGIVALPGMMTGVILGGATPLAAIKYQIMIMIAIVTSTVLSVFLAISFTRKICFTECWTLRREVFKKK